MEVWKDGMNEICKFWRKDGKKENYSDRKIRLLFHSVGGDGEGGDKVGDTTLTFYPERRLKSMT